MERASWSLDRVALMPVCLVMGHGRAAGTNTGLSKRGPVSQSPRPPRHAATHAAVLQRNSCREHIPENSQLIF